MDVQQQVPQSHGGLEQVLPGTPDVPLLYRPELGQHPIFLQQLIQGAQPAVHGAVIDQKVRILRPGVKRLHLEVHGGQGILLPAQVLEHILPAGHPDQLGDIVPRLAYVDPSVGGDVEEGHGLSGPLLVQDGSQAVQGLLEALLSLVLLS